MSVHLYSSDAEDLECVMHEGRIFSNSVGLMASRICLSYSVVSRMLNH